MSERKRPVKKKHTKKIKYSRTEKEKLKDKEKEKYLYPSSSSEMSVTRRRSVPNEEIYPDIIRLKSSEAPETLSRRASKRLDPDKKLSVDFANASIDDFDTNKRKSKEFSYKKSEDYVDPSKRKSRDFSEEVIRRKSREFQDDVAKRKSREFQDDVVKRKSREFQDDLHKRKSREYQDDLHKRKSREYQEYQDDVHRRKSRDIPDDIFRRKSGEFGNDSTKRKSREAHRLNEDMVRRKSKEIIEGKSHKRGGENVDYYKKYKYMRNSRVALAGIYKTTDREEAGEQSKIMVVPLDDPIWKPTKYDYVDPPDHERTHLKLAILWMEICGIAHLSLMLGYGFSEDFLSIVNYDVEAQDNYKTVSHYTFGSIWIFVCGNAIILFRVFNKSRTRSIKYFHVVMHTLGFAACLLSLYAYYEHWKEVGLANHNFSIHSKLGITGALAYMFQYLIGFSIYSMRMFRQRFRIQFYHYHSYIGFVVFFLSIMIMCSGLVIEEKFVLIGYSSNRFAFSWLARATGIIGIIFAGAVLFIIVYPYFDFAKETELI